MTAAHRRLVPPDELTGPPVEHVGGQPAPQNASQADRWVIRSYDTARRLLRDPEASEQAGFGAEQVMRQGVKMRPPVLYLEGLDHRAQRRAAARLFAPRVIEGYRGLIEELSDDLVGQLRTDRPQDLSRLSFSLAVQVVARVVGLTDSKASAMARRLNAFFDTDVSAKNRTPRALLALARNRTALLRFFYLDVRPAIRARRRRRGDDVISQLLDQGFSDLDILTECVTYGAAGMVTTREFITAAGWHLLSDADLLARYRSGTDEERSAILAETLRVEPVVGHLFRRTTTPITLDSPDGAVDLPPGTLVDLDIRAANGDPEVVGPEPTRICPGRQLQTAEAGPAPAPTLLSFGDGHHKCPGGPLALLESEIFLTKLLARDLVLDRTPRVQWNSVTQGYDLDECWVRLAR